MHNALTNLLPKERRHALSRDYYFRLGVVICVLVTILTLIAGGLLVPTYVLLVESMREKKAHLAEIKSTLSSADETVLSQRFAALSADAAVLMSLTKQVSTSNLMRDLLAISRPGITLTRFSYTPLSIKATKNGKGSATTQGSIVISGVAATRDALRTYQLALQAAPFVTTAALPISTYAEDINIGFTITVTLKS